MKISAFALALCAVFSSGLQTPSFEKEALALVQSMPVSTLDADLPPRPFAAWFNQLVGSQAGVFWQLSECGEQVGGQAGAEQDLAACAEVNASLLDGRKVIVLITVGTFKKGLAGKPAFFRAVVGRDEQLSQTLRLRDVPGMLNAPKGLPVAPPGKKPEKQLVNLPALNASRTRIESPFQFVPLLPSPLNFSIVRGDVNREEMPPPPQPVVKPLAQSIPKEPQKISEGGLRANAIVRTKPVYPPGAKQMNALGEVKVQILISEGGRVISAEAISGHMALRGAAEEAAYKWVFKPVTYNGTPVRAEGMLTFNFMRGAK
jgi:TonB family protein